MSGPPCGSSVISSPVRAARLRVGICAPTDSSRRNCPSRRDDSSIVLSPEIPQPNLSSWNSFTRPHGVRRGELVADAPVEERFADRKVLVGGAARDLLRAFQLEVLDLLRADP